MKTRRAGVANAARAWCAVALLLFTTLARAELVGPVVAILDGDTIDVLVDRQPIRVRLAQIDAPEKRQAFGTRARQTLAGLVFRQSVTVEEAGRDRYGRVIGAVYVSGVSVNAQMVELGMAWHGSIAGMRKIRRCLSWSDKPRSTSEVFGLIRIP